MNANAKQDLSELTVAKKLMKMVLAVSHRHVPMVVNVSRCPTGIFIVNVLKDLKEKFVNHQLLTFKILFSQIFSQMVTITNLYSSYCYVTFCGYLFLSVGGFCVFIVSLCQCL